MVRSFLVMGMVIMILASWVSSGHADARSIDMYEDLEIDFKISAKVVRTRSHWVKVILKNPITAVHSIDYIAEKRTKEGPVLPISFEIKNLQTGEIIKTSEPSPLIFMSGAAILERPKFKKGEPLKPGEEIMMNIDIKEYMRQLLPGNYEIRPVIWLPPGVPLISSMGYHVMISEEE